MNTLEPTNAKTPGNQSSTDYPADLYDHDALARALPTLEAIDDQAMQQYQQQGFIAIEQAFSHERIAAARQAIHDRILQLVREDHSDATIERWALDRWDQLPIADLQRAVRKLMGFVEDEPRLAALAEDEQMLGHVGRMMGGRRPVLFQDMALLKPPGGREKPWHQDNAYFRYPQGTPVVGVWIALDEATVDNGCMRFVPGSHRDGPVVHFRRRDWQLCDTERSGRHVVAVPLKPGGCIFFNGLTHHGTPTNRTDTGRRSVQFHYAPADVPQTTDEQRLAVFGSEGKNVEC